MAQPINFEDLAKLEVLPYNNLRNSLQTGDLLFCSGNYPISKAIEKVTGSVWSHVGIVYKVESLKRILLLESVEDVGVRFAPLSKYLEDYKGDRKPYDGQMVIARFSGGLSQEQVNEIISFGMDELTRPYDRDEALKILSRVVLGIGKEAHDREYLCSELVFECFQKAGIHLNYDPLGFISPQDIWLDPHVELVTKIQVK